MNSRGGARRTGDFEQEGAFALIAFDKMNQSAGLFGEADRQNHTRKSSA